LQYPAIDAASSRTDSTGVHSIAQARNNAANDEMWDGAGRSLESTANSKNNASNHDDPPSTQFFTKHHGQERTEETTLNMLDRRFRHQ
jgi:hypothetical protein